MPLLLPQFQEFPEWCLNLKPSGWKIILIEHFSEDEENWTEVGVKVDFPLVQIL